MLDLCLARIDLQKPGKISLARALNFNHRVAPCPLVIPLEATLTPSLPSNHEPGFLKTFRAFPNDPVTIEGVFLKVPHVTGDNCWLTCYEAVLDETTILNSQQRPRKISIRGSDGKIYSLLCKPKDDLRKDQRLMEFNSMINRFLKRDVESSKRRLCLFPTLEFCVIWPSYQANKSDRYQNLRRNAFERGVWIDRMGG